MNKINFETEKPVFDNGQTKWYIDSYFKKYIENEQAVNLPKLKGLGCFIVKGIDMNGEKVEDYVLINHKQETLGAYRYSIEGHDQMTVKINVLKITKHYDDNENK